MSAPTTAIAYSGFFNRRGSMAVVDIELATGLNGWGPLDSDLLDECCGHEVLDLMITHLSGRLATMFICHAVLGMTFVEIGEEFRIHASRARELYEQTRVDIQRLLEHDRAHQKRTIKAIMQHRKNSLRGLRAWRKRSRK